MPHLRPARLAAAILASLLVVGCLERPPGYEDPDEDGAATGIPARELDFRDRFATTSIRLDGTLRDEQGRPVAGASLRIGESTTVSADDGAFSLSELPRRTALLEVYHPAFRLELVAVHLHQPLDVDAVTLEPMPLTRQADDEVRFLFGGDVSMGRRFLSTDPPLDRVPQDDPEALIKASDPTPGSKQVMRGLRPLVQSVDFTSINLETVMTDQPDTPYQGKDYVFYSLPGSIPALQWLGVDYANLANNHIYDYLEAGVRDTLDHMQSYGLPYSGAGMTPAEAFEPYRAELAGWPYSFVGLCTIDGDKYPTLFIANDDKGGAAYGWDTDNLEARMDEELSAGRVPIINIHAGSEYIELPMESTRGRMVDLADMGAPLVIGHHPHVPQGVEWRGDALIFHSLGNFVLDQARLETLLSIAPIIDMKGGQVLQAQAIPLYIEDYHTRLFAGALADRLLRRVGESSTPYGGRFYPYLGRGWVPREGEGVVERRRVEVSVRVEAEGPNVIDLRGYADSSESLAALSTEASGLRVDLGRDIFGFGDMEDNDVDDELIETSRWWYSNGSSFPCLHETHRGAVAMCSYRDGDHRSASIFAGRNRIRVLGNPSDEPNKDLTLFGYTQAENAGEATIEVRYYAPLGSERFGEEFAYRHSGGSHDWKPFAADLSMPPDDPAHPGSRTRNARALRIFVEHRPPERDRGWFRLDDLAVITWRESHALDAPIELTTPHANDFLRISGEPGTYRFELIFERWRPAP